MCSTAQEETPEQKADELITWLQRRKCRKQSRIFTDCSELFNYKFPLPWKTDEQLQNSYNLIIKEFKLKKFNLEIMKTGKQFPKDSFSDFKNKKTI